MRALSRRFSAVLVAGLMKEFGSEQKQQHGGKRGSLTDYDICTSEFAMGETLLLEIADVHSDHAENEAPPHEKRGVQGGDLQSEGPATRMDLGENSNYFSARLSFLADFVEPAGEYEELALALDSIDSSKMEERSSSNTVAVCRNYSTLRKRSLSWSLSSGDIMDLAQLPALPVFGRRSSTKELSTASRPKKKRRTCKVEGLKSGHAVSTSRSAAATSATAESSVSRRKAKVPTKRKTRNRQFEIFRRKRVKKAMSRLKDMVVPHEERETATKITILQHAVQIMHKIHGVPMISFETFSKTHDHSRITHEAIDAAPNDLRRSIRERKRRLKTNWLEKQLAKLVKVDHCAKNTHVAKAREPTKVAILEATCRAIEEHMCADAKAGKQIAATGA